MKRLIMKKIALVSPHDQYNYGTVLQAYALQHAIEKHGYSAEYLGFSNAVPSPLWEKIIKKVLVSLKNKANKAASSGLDDYSFFASPEFEEFAKGFDNFINTRIKESPIRYNPLSLPTCSEYDAYMVGSDQTWGEARTPKNPIYFLDYANECYPWLSYAPSLGSTHISREYLQVLKAKLSKFKSLSCREMTNCKLLSDVLGRKVTYVLDPTLLLNASEWNKIAEQHQNTELKEKKYILCYILGEKQSISDYAEELGRMKGLPVYYVVTRPIYLYKKNHIFATPESFLSLIRDAHTVITDSFHGSIFSINYNTQFYSFTKRDDANSIDNDRIVEVLNTFHLLNRYKDGKKDFECDINFDEPNRILEDYRKSSEQYLNDILKEI